ncbi:MAG: T9SS type A sorting domain-containing protein [Bacteroidia bacterium]|nr:T9SS type A sorting domain-containing protein [Bacteroidia bacterium]
MKKLLLLSFILISAFCSMGQNAYRSVVTAGNWNSISSWERYNGTTWLAATTGQIPGLSDTAYIQTGHTISLTQNENVRDLNLHNITGTRIILAGFKLNLYGKLGCFSSAISTFPVTYTASTPSTSTWINTTTAGGAIKAVGNTRNLTNTSEWGNNPPGWMLEIALNAGQTVTTNTGLKMARLLISSGTLYTASGFDIRADSGAAATGDVIINAGTTLSLGGAMRRTSAVGSQFDSTIVLGTLEIRGNSGTPGLDMTTLLVGTGGKIKMTNTVPYTSVIVNFSYVPGSSLEYAGTTAQTVGGEFPNTVQVKKLIINNTTSLTIPSSRIISDTLTMIAGNIIIPSTDSLILGTTYPGILQRTTGTIIGKLDRYIPSGTTGSYLFPVGTAAFYRPMNVTFASATTGGGTISVNHVDGGISGSSIIAYTDGTYTVNRRSNMYWEGIVNSTFTAPSINISIDAAGQTGITAPSETRVTGSTDGVTFGSPGGTHSAGSGTIAYRNGFPFGGPLYFRAYLGGNATTNFLPVRIKNFSAESSANSVVLNWFTASEVNNNGFEIERSINGKNFEKIGFVKGVGNSTKLNQYQFVDHTIAGKTTFYRLKQLDFDGIYECSEIITVSEEDLSVIITPNPFINEINVVSKDFTQSLSLEVFDINGQIIKTMSGTGKILVHTNDLPVGIYFIRISNGKNVFVKRVIKN